MHSVPVQMGRMGGAGRVRLDRVGQTFCAVVVCNLQLSPLDFQCSSISSLRIILDQCGTRFLTWLDRHVVRQILGLILAGIPPSGLRDRHVGRFG